MVDSSDSPCALIKVEPDGLDALLEQAAGLVVILFHSRLCSSCAGMAESLRRAGDAAGGEITLAGVDVLEAIPETLAPYRIGTLPTTIMFLAGHEVARLTGARPVSFICRVIGDALPAGSRGKSLDMLNT